MADQNGRQTVVVGDLPTLNLEGMGSNPLRSILLSSSLTHTHIPREI